MDTGFETIGNAILTLYDGGRPILVTDPWFTDQAYFGSWGQSHEIPEAQMKGILGAEYVWVSHGHPDHLNADSMPQLMGKKILLPDHVGKRIQDDLKGQGYEVHVMKDRQWYPLSKNIRVYCISDLNQDAVLLADVNGRLIFNRTDASDHGWENHVRSIIKRYPVSFMMGLSSRFGDADMINFFDEEGAAFRPQKWYRKLAGAMPIAPKPWAQNTLSLSAQCIPTSARIRPGPMFTTPHWRTTGRASNPTSAACCRRIFATTAATIVGRKSGQGKCR